MTLNVVDVSSNNPINAAITSGADGCIVKVSQGTYYVNPSCDAQYQIAKSKGLKLGVYHYGGGNDAVAEADYFLAHAAGYIHEAILILDWEAAQNANYNDNNWCRRFVDRVHEKTGVWCIIYGNRQDINHCTNLVDDCGLWFAGYPTNTQRDWNAPNFMYDISPWKNMVGWQYSAADVDRSKFYITKEQWDAYAKGNKPVPPTPTGKNGIAIDNVSKDKATKMVQFIQSKYAWTLLREQVKRVFQPNKVYTLQIKCDSKWKLDNAVNRLKQELKNYHPEYMQQNIAIVDGDKPSARIEARNLNDAQSKWAESHMRNFLKDVLLADQTVGNPNSYGTWDVRVKGEGFNDTDAPIVLKEIIAEGKKNGIVDGHIKGFKF